MNNLQFSDSSNIYKIKVNPQNTNSITQNTKLNEYPEKNRKFHKSPVQTLNKSQNISQNTFKTNIKNKIINHNIKQLNAKKINPLQNFKNFNPINKKDNSIKINPLQNQNNLSISKNNSLSNYFVKTSNNNNKPNLRRNNTNSNIFTMQNNTNNNNNSKYIIDTHQNFYQKKSNLYNYKKSQLNKIKDYLTTDNFIIKKNKRNSSLNPLTINKESKKKQNNDEKKSNSKVKKTESASNTFIKKNHSSIKKLKTSSTSLLNKKTNFIVNTMNKYNSNNKQNKSRVQSNILGNPTSSSGGYIENLSTEKTSGCARMDNFEIKIINEIKDLKKFKDNEMAEKIKIIFEETIDYLIPKESQNVFLLLLKEISNINNEYCENVKNMKNIIEQLKIKIVNYEKRYADLVNKYKKKEKELINLKNELDIFNKEKEIICNNDNTNKKIHVDKLKLKRNNSYFRYLNTKNIDDLDALYFFDKVEYNQNEEKDIPKLNLEQKHIEKCIQKELIKRNEKNLTPFQKIALQFEMTES